MSFVFDHSARSQLNNVMSSLDLYLILVLFTSLSRCIVPSLLITHYTL